MSLTDKYTDIATALRKQYGTTDKYRLADMPTLIDRLEVHNFLDSELFLNSETDNNAITGKPVTGINVDTWNKYLVGKSVTASFDIEVTNYDSAKDSRHRVGFEFQTTHEDGSTHYTGAWLYPPSANYVGHVAQTYKLVDSPIKSIDYNDMYDQLNSDAVVKMTNLKLVINPLGG